MQNKQKNKNEIVKIVNVLGKYANEAGVMMLIREEVEPQTILYKS